MNLVGENVQALPDEELVKLETRVSFFVALNFVFFEFIGKKMMNKF